MRTFISTVCIAVTLISAASCDKNYDNISVKSDGRTVINGVAEAVGNGTKAYNAYCYEVRWQENDEIYVTQSDGTDDLFVLEEGIDTPKGRFVEKGSKGITGEIEAFYPASLKDGNDYVWPAVQSNDQVAPMYARQTITGAEGETVSFSSLGAMLQIVFNSTTPGITVTSVNIEDNSAPLSGCFTVEDGKAILSDATNPGITLDLGSGVEMGSSAKYFYISIPARSYAGHRLTLTFNSSDGGYCKMASTLFPDVERNTVGRITLSGSFKYTVPEGAVSSKFTVNASGKQVYFSKGNLQATYHSSSDKYTWAFAEHQYDYVGNASGNTTINIRDMERRQPDGAKVDLFGWRPKQFGGEGTPEYYGINVSINGSDYGGYGGDVDVDWGSAIDDKGTWRALDIYEWRYMFNTRTVNGGTGIGKTYSLNIIYGGKMGLVIYPDNYTGNPISGTVTELPDGVVFLPTAGRRYGSEVAGCGGNGYYWTSTAYDSINSRYFKFTDTSIYLDDLNYRYYGYSVRLVSDVR